MRPEIERVLMEPMHYHFFLDLGHPIRKIAFYDRASSPHQQRTPIRSATCDYAEASAKEHGWELARSFDERNQGVCFLDVQSRCSAIRPQFERATLLPDVDAIAVWFSDRLGAHPSLGSVLGIARCRGKSVISFDAASLRLSTLLSFAIASESARLPKELGGE